MVIKNGVTRVFRTPVITIFFFLCILTAEATFSLGINLWVQNHQRITQYEKNFKTIATVEQVKTGVRRVEQWDASKQEYVLYQLPQYKNKLSTKRLKCEGLTYVDEPEKRAYYKSYAPEYELKLDQNSIDGAVVEFEPVQTCIPDSSVPIRIKNVLSSETAAIREGNTIYFCAHSEAVPEELKEGQTYIAYITLGCPVHGNGFENLEAYEYHPVSIASSQSDRDGVRKRGTLSDIYLSGGELDGYYCVDETFTGSEMEEYYRACAGAVDKERRSLPVTATGNTDLIMAFYNQDAYITEGADITKEEYKEGARVCLVSRDFAKNNGLKVGDSVALSLYAAYYGVPATNSSYVQSILNAEGGDYPVFEESAYEIKGIYDVVAGMVGQSYGVAQNEIFIPRKSVKNSDADNIALDLEMSAETTSFSIENGTMDEFLKVWNKVGTEELNLTFYDGGYSKFERGLNNMKIFSACLAVIGAVLIGLVLMIYSYIFVMQHKESIVTERLLGMTKKQSMMSVAAGAFLVLTAGSIGGGAVAAVLFKMIPENFLNVSYFDTTYSYHMVKAMGKTMAMETIRPETGILAGGLLIVIVGMLLVFYRVRKILQMELIQILGKNEV